MDKLLYLGLSIQDISKIAMYEYWYDYIKTKYDYIAKLCYMDTAWSTKFISVNR